MDKLEPMEPHSSYFVPLVIAKPVGRVGEEVPKCKIEEEAEEACEFDNTLCRGCVGRNGAGELERILWRGWGTVGAGNA